MKAAHQILKGGVDLSSSGGPRQDVSSFAPRMEGWASALRDTQMMAAGAAKAAAMARAQPAFLPPSIDLHSIILPGLGETSTPRAVPQFPTWLAQDCVAQVNSLKRQREEGVSSWESSKCRDETMSTSWDFERPRKEAPNFTSSELDLSLKVGCGRI